MKLLGWKCDICGKEYVGTNDNDTYHIAPYSIVIKIENDNVISARKNINLPEICGYCYRILDDFLINYLPDKK
jgi:hypothetical protein